MKRAALLSGLIAVLASVAFPSTAAAAAYSGTLSISDSQNGVTVSADSITWLGSFGVGVPSTGSFSGLVGTTGNELNLTSTAQPAGGPFPAIAPNTFLAGEGEVLAGFLTLAGLPTASFDLNFIDLGSFSAAQCSDPAAAGQTCSLPGTPFNFSNQTASSSSVSLALSGFVRNTLTGELSTFTGIYTSQFTVPFQTLLASLETGGSITNTYSGTFTAVVAPVPEPLTMLTFGTGMAIIGRRFSRKRSKQV